jgi:tetratricopeptide (TPR) repeat protein
MNLLFPSRFVRSALVGVGALLLALGSAIDAPAQSASRGKRERAGDDKVANLPAATAPTSFAPMPAGHPLSEFWNDPEFTRRLLGSYGFLSDAEPRLSPEEQAVYRDKIVPLLREDPKKAIPELEGALKPGASAVFDYTLGTVYFQSEDFTNAVKYYEQSLAKFPDYRRAQRNLALALVRDGKYEQAIKPLTRTVALGGADGRIYGLLGFAHLNAGRFVSAQGAYQQAAVFEPENLDFQLGLVKATLGLNQYDAAIALLDELIQQNPDKDNLWALQANVFIQREQPAKAVVNLEILRKLDKATAAQLGLLGDLYLTLDNRDQALSAYAAAIEKDGGKTPDRGLRPAEILLGRGAAAQAGALLAKVRASGSVDGEAELKLLKLEARVAMATGDAAKGVETLEALVQRNPLDGEALLLAGDYYARNGQPEKAEFRYDAAAKLEAHAPDAYLKHAQLKVQQQKYTEAVELLRRAQKAKPRDNVARYLERVEQVAARARS